MRLAAMKHDRCTFLCPQVPGAASGGLARRIAGVVPNARLRRDGHSALRPAGRAEGRLIGARI